MTEPAALGAHDGHQVHPHDHSGQDHKNRRPEDWCSGKYLCVTCMSEALPCGTWFSGPKCERPVKAAAKGGMT